MDSEAVDEYADGVVIRFYCSTKLDRNSLSLPLTHPRSLFPPCSSA